MLGHLENSKGEIMEKHGRHVPHSTAEYMSCDSLAWCRSALVVLLSNHKRVNQIFP